MGEQQRFSFSAMWNHRTQLVLVGGGFLFFGIGSLVILVGGEAENPVLWMALVLGFLSMACVNAAMYVDRDRIATEESSRTIQQLRRKLESWIEATGAASPREFSKRTKPNVPLQDNAKTQEGNSLSRKLAEKDREISALKSEIRSLKLELSQLQAASDHAKVEYSRTISDKERESQELRTQINSLKKSVSKGEKLRDQLRSHISEGQHLSPEILVARDAKVRSLNEEVERLRQEIAAQVDKLNRDRGVHVEITRQLNERIYSIFAEKEALGETNRTLAAEAKEARERLDDALSQLQELQTTSETLREQYGNLQLQSSTLVSANTERINQMSREHSSALLAERRSKMELADRIGELETEVATLKQKLQAAESELAGKRRKIESMEGGKRRSEVAIAALQEEKERIKASVEERVRGEVADKERELESIRQELQERDRELATLKKKLNVSNRKNGGFKKTIKTLEARAFTHRDKIRVLQAECHELQKVPAELQTEIDRLKSEIKALKDRLSRKETANAAGDIQRANNVIELHGRRTKQLEAEIARLREKLSKFEEASEGLGSDATESQEVVPGRDLRHTSLITEGDERQESSLVQLEERVSQTEDRLREAEDRSQAAESESARMKKKLNALAEDFDSLKSELTRMKEGLGNLVSDNGPVFLSMLALMESLAPLEEAQQLANSILPALDAELSQQSADQMLASCRDILTVVSTSPCKESDILPYLDGVLESIRNVLSSAA